MKQNMRSRFTKNANNMYRYISYHELKIVSSKTLNQRRIAKARESLSSLNKFAQFATFGLEKDVTMTLNRRLFTPNLLVFIKHILLITMLTIKILSTINSLKKNYSVKTLFTIPFV